MKNKVQDTEIQEMVMERAAEIIAQRGPKGWSISELAKACGLARNTLYKIIGSKEELLESIVLAQIDATTHMLRGIIREEKGGRFASLRIGREGPAFFSERPRVAFPEIFLEYPAIGKKAREHQKVAAAEVIDFIRKWQAEGYIRNDVDPPFLYDLVRGLIEHYTRSGLKGKALMKSIGLALQIMWEGMRLGEW